MRVVCSPSIHRSARLPWLTVSSTAKIQDGLPPHRIHRAVPPPLLPPLSPPRFSYLTFPSLSVPRDRPPDRPVGVPVTDDNVAESPCLRVTGRGNLYTIRYVPIVANKRRGHNLRDFAESRGAKCMNLESHPDRLSMPASRRPRHRVAYRRMENLWRKSPTLSIRRHRVAKQPGSRRPAVPSQRMFPTESISEPHWP